MTKGPDGDKGKRSKDRSGAKASSSGGAGQKGAAQGKSKKKGLKTTISNVSNAPVKTPAKAAPVVEEQPSIAQIEESVEEAEKPKRKVPKTLLFNPASVLEAAARQVAGEKEGVKEADPVADEQPTEEEPTAGQKQKRKVPKTLLFDTASVQEAAAAAANSAGTQERAPSEQPSSAIKASEAEPVAAEISPRKVPKTLLYDPSKVLEAAAAAVQEQEAQRSQPRAPEPVAEPGTEPVAEKISEAEQAAPETATRKVPKTLLYDPSKVLEAAAAAAAAATPVASPVASPDTAPAAPVPATGQVEKGQEPARKKVPKTLLFDYDPSKVLEAAAAAQEQEAARVEANAPVEEVAPIAQALPTKRSGHPAFDDPPPELKIDSPPVLLFFEEPVTTQAGPEAASTAAAEEAPVDPPVEKAKRRVPRTLLFNPIMGEDGIEIDPGQPAAAPVESSSASHVGSDQSFVPEAIAPRRISTKKIAKTLLYSAPEGLDAGGPRIIASTSTGAGSGAEGQSTIESPLDTQEAEKVVERYIARTMLDHEILYKELSKSQHKLEEKAIEVAKEKANEPFKPFFPIDCKKMALPCTWTWDESYSTERYRYCGQCQRPVYNFTGLEIADAEEIILKAENRAKFTLYKRTDGKYMTGDCPVAVKRRSDFILMSVGGILVAFVLVVYMATLPKPKPKPASEPVASAQTKHLPGIKSAKRPAGSGRYIPGKGFVLDPVTTPAPVQPAPVATTSTPATDENPVWEYNAPQAGNQQIVDPRAPAPIYPQAPAPTPTQQEPAPTVDPAQQQGAQPGQSPYVKTYR
jgi:hypothetical protein